MSDIKAFHKRQEKIYSYLCENKIDTVVIADFEGNRNKSIRYLCAHPQDALLFLFAEGSCTLVPWDIPLAEQVAVVNSFIPYTNYKRSLTRAIQDIAGGSTVVELSGTLAYPVVHEIVSLMKGVNVLCRKQGIDSYLMDLRSIKDEIEIEYIRKACGITNRIIDKVERVLRNKVLTELELALFIEAQAREMGAEGMAFESLIASPERSFAIHAFPAYTSKPFGLKGFSIADFGIRFCGYTSDVTFTAVRGALSRRQEKMIEALIEVYDFALSLIKLGEKPSFIAQQADERFAEHGFRMPHGLGHGLGLAAHERPFFRAHAREDEMPLMKGMAFTLEPGIYDPDEGGIRLENDILCTGEGVEVLTKSSLIRLPEQEE